MSQFLNSSSFPEQNLADSHHDLLSVSRKPEQSLLSHLNAGRVDPLGMLFPEESLPEEALLQDVSVEPAAEEATSKAPIMVPLEKGQPLSKCMLWQIQENYYANAGINAWESNVPCFITSSVYIAESYAEMILGFLRDVWDTLDLSEPVYIVELATGTGRLSHMLLGELERKMASFAHFKGLQLKYVMTDFTDSNPRFWEGHEKFQPYVDKGLLDFAVLNPLVEASFTLRRSGRTVSSDTVKNPVIAIANYFFDSIPQDVFRVEGKRLHEGLVTLERNVQGVHLDSCPTIDQVEASYQYRELRHERYYDDEKFNAILRYYRHNIKEGTVIFPLGGLRVSQNLQTLSNHRMMLIASDKAYCEIDNMLDYGEHTFVMHGGAFSYMVNFDAIGRYFMNEAGGRYFHTKGWNHSLQTVCCIEMPGMDRPYEMLSYVYNEKLNRSNAINSVCAIMPGGRPNIELVRIDAILSQFRLNLADPKIFVMMGQELIDLMPHFIDAHYHDLRILMQEAWNRYYYFPGEVNLPFWFSQFCYYLNQHEESIFYAEKTIEYFGTHEALLFMKGQSLEQLDRWDEAIRMYETALELKPDMEESQRALHEARKHVRR